MANRTTQELARSILEGAGILNPDESPDASDSSYVIGRYTALYDGLVMDELAYWDIDAIPDIVFLPLGDLVWLHCAKAFGKPAPEGRDLEEAEASCKRRIRRYARKASSKLDTYQDDF